MVIAGPRRPAGTSPDLGPFVSELAAAWHRDRPDQPMRELTGTLVFADISGFTRLTERLARQGRAGAEEMSDHLDVVLSSLLTAAYDHGGWLVKWGGDALLLGFDAAEHAALGCAAAAAMRERMRRVGVLDTSVGRVRLRMSVGVHTGNFDFHLVGHRHRELLITGEAATVTARLEATAEAGEILISSQTAGLLPPECSGDGKGTGILLAHSPRPRLPDQPSPGPAGEVAALVPELVADHLRSGGGTGEHRHVAVAFLEFSGMARLRAADGTSAVTAGLRHLVEAAQEACHRNGVSFHETDIAPDGGKLMLVAGAPRGLDDPAEAMLCTLRQVFDDPGPLSVRAGVTAGRAFTGAVGPARRRSYSVKGDVVNLAARIMGKAPAGQIWALPVVVEASRTTFDLADVPRFTVKGKSAPVLVRAVGSPLARRDVGHDLPLIGRAEAMTTLTDCLADARAGRGRRITVTGAVGVGKTRLITELVAQAGDTTVHSCSAELYRAASPYSLLRPLLREALGVADGAPAEAYDAIARWCRSHAAEQLPWLPLLGAVLGTTVADSPQTRDLAPEFRTDRIQRLIGDLLRVALRGPTLIVVDDMQFADDASADVLRQLGNEVSDLPWLIVLADRGEHDVAEDSGASRTLVLEPLNAEQSLVLVAADTDDAPLAPHLASAVVARAGGNPLFLRQLGAAAHSVADSEDLPNSIETVVAARIDRLRPAARDVLRAVAVAGLAIDRPMLDDLLDISSAPDRSPAHAGIDELSEFLVADDTTVRFRQAVIRDAAYEGLPFRRRTELHRRLAGLLAARPAADDESFALLSLHYLRAGDAANALPLARTAADRAATAYANTEAVLLYDRALRAADRLPDVSAAARSELLEGLGDAQVRLGEYAASDRSYASACRLLRGQPHAVARIGLKQARTATLRAAYGVVGRRLRRVSAVLAGVDDRVAASLRLEVTLCAAFTQFRQGRLSAARRSYAAVVERGHERRDRKTIADALAMLDVVEASLGVVVDGSRSRRALRLQEKCGDLAGQARALTQIGYRAYLAGDWDEAVQTWSAARALVERLGDLPNVAVTDANLAEILLDQGRLDDAEAALRRAIRVWRASQSDNEVAFGRMLLGRVLAKLGRYDEAAAALDQAHARFVAQGAKSEVVDADAYRAECLQLSGQPVAALELATQTLAVAQRLSQQPVQAPLLHRIIGACHDALGRFDDGDREFEQSLALARARGAGHEVAFSLGAMAARSRRRNTDLGPAERGELRALQRRLGLVIDLTIPRPATAEPVTGVPRPRPRTVTVDADQVTA